MAKGTTTSTGGHRSNSKKRPGIHSKNRSSKIKTSKNYKKKYRGQGR